MKNKILLLFQSIFTSCVKDNVRIAMAMTQNCLARHELAFRVSLYLLNN